MTGDLKTANKCGLEGPVISGCIAGVSGGISGYRDAIKYGVNPWTGVPNKIQPIQPSVTTTTPYQKGQEGCLAQWRRRANAPWHGWRHSFASKRKLRGYSLRVRSGRSNRGSSSRSRRGHRFRSRTC